MDRMWSPWRSAYVSEANDREPADDESIFTALLREERDEENLILWRGEHVFVIMNRHPYNSGHLLILPYREVTQYDALNAPEQQALTAALDRCMGWLREAVSPDGFNVGMNLGRAAGAGIPDHLHAHVVPRWDGDTNFMATTANTKVLPEDLQTTYGKLRAAMARDARDTTKPAAQKPSE
ncbi:HIT family protein [Salinibacter ruber]|uniref:HIT family protein n=2 Tax=Salinibacter ruber TaxID=146919 RepID=UPI0020744E72|nr:HIT domain-containing protein [Salinibacter ruber]MCS3665152.1 ATP adenylyltransferase [Salinibacter ruber]MCS3861008.1 ATP adenylyltransferase [Salinibacter ruber]